MIRGAMMRLVRRLPIDVRKTKVQSEFDKAGRLRLKLFRQFGNPYWAEASNLNNQSADSEGLGIPGL